MKIALTTPPPIPDKKTSHLDIGFMHSLQFFFFWIFFFAANICIIVHCCATLINIEKKINGTGSCVSFHHARTEIKKKNIYAKLQTLGMKVKVEQHVLNFELVWNQDTHNLDGINLEAGVKMQGSKIQPTVEEEKDDGGRKEMSDHLLENHRVVAYIWQREPPAPVQEQNMISFKRLLT